MTDHARIQSLGDWAATAKSGHWNMDFAHAPVGGMTMMQHVIGQEQYLVYVLDIAHPEIPLAGFQEREDAIERALSIMDGADVHSVEVRAPGGQVIFRSHDED